MKDQIALFASIIFSAALYFSACDKTPTSSDPEKAKEIATLL